MISVWLSLLRCCHLTKAKCQISTAMSVTIQTLQPSFPPALRCLKKQKMTDTEKRGRAELMTQFEILTNRPLTFSIFHYSILTSLKTSWQLRMTENVTESNDFYWSMKPFSVPNCRTPILKKADNTILYRTIYQCSKQSHLWGWWHQLKSTVITQNGWEDILEDTGELIFNTQAHTSLFLGCITISQISTKTFPGRRRHYCN